MDFDRDHVNALRLDGEFTAAHEYCLSCFPHPDAYAEEGFNCHRGLGVPLDHEEGSRYDKLAADGGSAQGMYQLGAYTYRSKEKMGLPTDEAMGLIRNAVRLGWLDAKLFLGKILLFEQNNENAPDYGKIRAAMKLFRECSDSGDLRGMFFLSVGAALGFEDRPLRSHARRLRRRSFVRMRSGTVKNTAHTQEDLPVAASAVLRPSRWIRRRSTLPHVSTLQMLFILDGDAHVDRRCVSSLRNHVLKIIETRAPIVLRY